MSKGSGRVSSSGGKVERTTDGRQNRGNRRKARELAVQALYQCAITDDYMGVVIDQLLETQQAKRADISYFRRLAEGCWKTREELDKWISSKTDSWDVERISTVDRNILRLGIYELTADIDDVPAKVAINESIEVAKRYGGKGSARFVNGVLDSVARDLRQGKSAESATRSRLAPEPVAIPAGISPDQAPDQFSVTELEGATKPAPRQRQILRKKSRPAVARDSRPILNKVSKPASAQVSEPASVQVSEPVEKVTPKSASVPESEPAPVQESKSAPVETPPQLPEETPEPIADQGEG
ncbi:MAG: transcription antitermination factor NusB [Magnetococcales bacterium]|nr:transcription antitermination factor NusB [Magnetococcales bacterium]